MNISNICYNKCVLIDACETAINRWIIEIYNFRRYINMDDY